MADIRNNGSDLDLKLRDSEKVNGESSSDVDEKGRDMLPSAANVLKSMKNIKKNKVPVVVDVIVAVLLIALIVGAVFGVQYLLRYYSSDYESVDVTFVFAVKKVVLPGGDTYADMKNDYLLYDVDGNTLGFGSIKSAVYSHESDMLLLTVEVNAKYKDREGYSVGDTALAVGMSYDLRTEEMELCGTVVELYGEE